MGRRRAASPEPTIRSGLLLVDHAARTGRFQGLDRREVYADGRVTITTQGPQGEVVTEREVAFGAWLKSVGG